LTVGAATLAIAACGCCGFAALVLPGPDWRVHESQKGGFRVELPADPRADMHKRLGLRRAIAVEGTYLWTRAENYAVAYLDLPPGRLGLWRGADDQLLDEQVKNLTTNNEVQRLIRTDRIEVGGFPGREFHYTTRNGGTYTGRVILAGKRVFILLAGGRFTQAGNENVRVFLDSFELTDPALVAEGERRQNRAAGKDGEAARQEVRDQLMDAGAAAAAAALAAVEETLAK
jgi:hypothetical protein